MIAFGIAILYFARGLRSGYHDPIFRVLVIALTLDLAAGTFAYMALEGWDIVDALYFCVVTQAKVGFGDLTPQTTAGKLFTVGYILTGIALIVAFAQRLGRHIFHQLDDIALRHAGTSGERSAADETSESPRTPD
jgi:hypothetical protein